MSYLANVVDSYGGVNVTSSLSNIQFKLDGYTALKNLSSDQPYPTNYGVIYTKTDGKLYYNSVTGTQVIVGGNSLNGFINIKNTPYNAYGDNIHDDTAVIQQAINDAYSQNLAVFIPAGTYLVSSNITLTSNCEIYGVYNRSILNYVQPSATANSYIFVAANAQSNIYIHDLNFTTPDNTNAANGAIGIEGIAGSNNIAYVRCYFSNFSDWAFTNSVNITNILVSDCNITNIYQIPQSTGLSVRYTQGGIFVRNFISKISNSDSRCHAVYAPGVNYDIIFAENVIDSCTSGFSIGTSSGPYNYNNVVIGNVIKNVFYTGIFMVNIVSSLVSNNTIRCNPYGNGGEPLGIAIGPDMVGWTVSDNIINTDSYPFTGYANYGSGINVTYSNNNGIITGNTITNDQFLATNSNGIIVYTGNNILISNNNIKNMYCGIQLISDNGAIDQVVIENNQILIDNDAYQPFSSIGLVNAGVSINGNNTDIFTLNNFINNYEYGVYIGDSHSHGSGQNLLVKDNIFYNSTLYVLIDAGSTASNVLIEDNYINGAGQPTNGVSNSGSGTNVLARNNISLSRGFAPDSQYFAPAAMTAMNIDTLEPPNGALVENIYGYQSQRIYIKCNTGNTFTVQNNSGIILSNGANFVMTAGDTLTLVQFDANVWVEIGRTVSGTLYGTVSSAQTAGQVAYFDSSYDLTSSANLYWNNSAGRLGIGTSSPTTQLSVIGNANIDGYLALQETSAPSSIPGFGTIYTKSSDHNLYYISSTGVVSELTPPSTGSITGSGTSNQLTYWTGTSSVSGNSNLTWDGYHLSVNSATPNTAFYVNGDGYFGHALEVVYGIKDDGYLTVSGVTTIPTGSASSPSLTFSGETNTGLYKVSAGNIGLSVLGSQVLSIDNNTTKTVLLGASTVGSGLGSVALGQLASTSTYNYSVAIGYNAAVTGVSSIAIGENTISNNTETTAIGNAAKAYGLADIAIGYVSTTTSGQTGQQNIAIGSGAAVLTTSSSNSIAIGGGATTNGTGAIAIGPSAGTGNSQAGAASTSVAIGQNTSTVTNSVAIGNAASGYGNQSVALGVSALSAGQYDIAIGSSASTTSGQTGNGNIAIGRSANTASTSSSEAIAIGQLATTNGVYAISVGYFAGLGLGSVQTGVGQNSIGIGRYAQVGGEFAVGIGDNVYTDAYNYAVALGGSSSVLGTQGIAIGFNAGSGNGYTGVGSNSIALGAYSSSSGTNSMALGPGANSGNFASSIAIGYNASVYANQQIMLGLSNQTVVMPGGTQLDGYYLTMKESSTNPSVITNYGSLYTKTDHNLYFESSTGTVTQLTPVASGSVTGTGVASQLAFWSGTSAITGSNNLTWDGTHLSVNSATPNTSFYVVGDGYFSHALEAGYGIKSDGYLQVSGNVKFPISTVSSNYSVTTANYTILANALSAPFTITLPNPSGNTGLIINIKKIDSNNSNAITVVAAAGTIDGSSSYSISSQYASTTFQTDGSNWWAI